MKVQLFGKEMEIKKELIIFIVPGLVLLGALLGSLMLSSRGDIIIEDGQTRMQQPSANSGAGGVRPVSGPGGVSAAGGHVGEGMGGFSGAATGDISGNSVDAGGFSGAPADAAGGTGLAAGSAGPGGGEAGGFHGALVGGPVGGVEVLGPQGPGGVLPGGGGAGGANDDGGAAAGAGGGGATWVTSFSPGVSTLVASAGGGGGVDTGGAAGGGGAAAAAAERRGWPQPVQNGGDGNQQVGQDQLQIASRLREHGFHKPNKAGHRFRWPAR